MFTSVYLRKSKQIYWWTENEWSGHENESYNVATILQLDRRSENNSVHVPTALRFSRFYFIVTASLLKTLRGTLDHTFYGLTRTKYPIPVVFDTYIHNLLDLRIMDIAQRAIFTNRNLSNLEVFFCRIRRPANKYRQLLLSTCAKNRLLWERMIHA